jgi:hypothetical protein
VLQSAGTVVATVLTLLLRVQGGPPVEPVPITSHAVSSVVFATWGADAEPNGEGRLKFLVLTRGSPDWILPAKPEDTHFSLASHLDPSWPTSEAVLIEQYVTVGKISYTVSVNRRANTVSIGPLTVSLRGVNAVLIDGIDSPDWPHVVQTLWVEPKMVDPMSISTLIRGNNELRYFLRCDQQVDNPIKQQVIDGLCAQR